MSGLAGSLLVFTGVWHAFEWMMGGRNRDTARLIVPGIVYVILGYLLITLQFYPMVQWVALVLTAAGMTAAFTMRKTMQVRTWVTWAFIIIDAVIVLALLAALLG